MKRLITVVIVLALPICALALIEQQWTASELRAQAEVIVIATPVEVKDTAERVALLGVAHAGQTTNIMYTGIETTFRTLAVEQGSMRTNTFVLHHYHLAEPEKVARYQIYDIGYLWFEPKDKKRYRLFLRREDDGRYAPVSEQWHPALSVQEVQGAQP